MADFARVRKVDVHVHINAKDPALIEQAKTYPDVGEPRMERG